jgi:hypothetical protein
MAFIHISFPALPEDAGPAAVTIVQKLGGDDAIGAKVPEILS